jgi:histidine triad (HIT) family protein
VDPDCLFCGIVAGTVAAHRVREDEWTLAFDDIVPQAPVHVLVIPRAHIRDITDLAADAATSTAVMAAIREVVLQLAVEDFRVVFNTGVQGGQHVFHVHAHVLAGRPFTWPPG